MLWLTLAAAVALLYLFAIAPGRIPKAAPDLLWTSSYAHRGLHNREKTIPENSLAAFEEAVAAGYGIELDINLTADDQVVVFHDDTLLRVCGVDKPVGACTYEELRQYRLFGTDEKIPLFSDVLALVGGRVPLVVELKTPKRRQRLCELAAAMLRDYAGPYCIESFHPAIVAWFGKHEPGVVRGQLAMGEKQYENLPRYQAHLMSQLLTNAFARPHFMAYRHQDAHGSLPLALYRLLGGKRIAWTVRDTDDIAWCRAYFDAIIFEFFRA